MPLNHSKSKKAFKSNVKAEVEAGKPLNQSLAVAYSVKRKAKKMAEGGSVTVPQEKRPMPESTYNDAHNVSQNDHKKAPARGDNMKQDDISFQAKANSSMKVRPIKHPKMVPQSGFTSKLRDQEDDLMETAKPGPYGAPPKKMAEGGKIDPQTIDGVSTRRPTRGSAEEFEQGMHERNNKSKIYEKKSQKNLAKQGYLKSSGPPADPKKPLRGMAEGGMINGVLSMSSAEEDKEPHESPIRESYRRPPQDEYMSDHEQMLAEGGEVSPDSEIADAHDASVAAACMARMKARAEARSGSPDMDKAVRMADGGEITQGRDHSDILSHDSIYSDDSDQADLSRNADEDANEEDQLSFDSLMKENYSESDGLDQLNQPEDSNEKGDEREDKESDRHDRASAIMRKMRKR